MANIVTGDRYMELDGQLLEIKRQLRQKDGYPFDPERLGRALQAIVEGRFSDIDIVGVKPAAAKFVVADHFKEGASDSAPVKIASVNRKFRRWFYGKIEETQDLTTPINHVQLNMSGIYELMKTYNNPNNGFTEFFRVCDASGVVRVVEVSWSTKGWRVSASSIANPFRG